MDNPRTRRNNVVVYGIPNNEQENHFKLEVEVCEKMETKIEGKEINAAYWFSFKKNRSPPSPFIMKFVSKFAKEELMKNAREKKPKMDFWEKAVTRNYFLTSTSQRKI